jgi:hypothetical protein
VSVVVYANYQGGVSGPTLQAGDSIQTTASGIWCMGGDTECGGADGIRSASAAEPDVVLPSSPMGTLIAQVGSDPLFALGSSASFTAQTSGTLTLLFDDRACCYGDNTRFITVEVVVSPIADVGTHTAWRAATAILMPTLPDAVAAAFDNRPRPKARMKRGATR